MSSWSSEVGHEQLVMSSWCMVMRACSLDHMNAMELFNCTHPKMCNNFNVFMLLCRNPFVQSFHFVEGWWKMAQEKTTWSSIFRFPCNNDISQKLVDGVWPTKTYSIFLPITKQFFIHNELLSIIWSFSSSRTNNKDRLYFVNDIKRL